MMDAKLQAQFAKRLHAIMARLEVSRQQPNIRGVIGSVALSALCNTKARSWTELKQKLSGEGYDRILQALGTNATEMQKRGHKQGVQGLEALGVSLIARRQGDPALEPVVKMLDDYIEKCVAAARRAPMRPAAKA